MTEAICGVSEKQREAAIKIAKKEIERWLGAPAAFRIRSVIRTNARYKVKGFAKLKCLEAVLDDGGGQAYEMQIDDVGGQAFEVLFVMCAEGDGYELLSLIMGGTVAHTGAGA